MTYLLRAAGAVLAVLLASGVIAWAARDLKVDRYEDGAQSDRDVQAIKDSMRGTL